MIRKLRSFQPKIGDALESRVLLHVGFARHAAAEISIAARRVVPRVKIGALGDSYSDEYAFYAPDRSKARNWVEQLAALRRVDFGAYSLRRRAEPRNAGFANDWARSDATSSDMIRLQLPGLERQVRRGVVKYVNILVGGNDYLIYLRNLLTAPVTTQQIVSDLGSIGARVAANVRAAVARLEAANPAARIVLMTLPDVREIPAVRIGAGLIPGSDQVLAAVGSSIDGVNDSLRSLADANPHVAIGDLNALFHAAPPGASSFRFGGERIRVNTAGDDFHNAFLADQIHIGTVLQGLVANLFLQTSARFGIRVSPLGPREIIRFAQQVKPK